MRFLFIFLLLSIPIFSKAQIVIDSDNESYKRTISKALEKIALIDSIYYRRILDVCDTVLVRNSNFSTCGYDLAGGGKIIISSKDLEIPLLDNICAVLIHESLHLRIDILGMNMNTDDEEIVCYSYELLFLLKIPNVDPGLIEHAKAQIRKRSNR